MKRVVVTYKMLRGFEGHLMPPWAPADTYQVIEYWPSLTEAYEVLNEDPYFVEAEEEEE